jgi:hypothetical protein
MSNKKFNTLFYILTDKSFLTLPFEEQKEMVFDIDIKTPVETLVKVYKKLPLELKMDLEINHFFISISKEILQFVPLSFKKNYVYDLIEIGCFPFLDKDVKNNKMMAKHAIKMTKDNYFFLEDLKGDKEFFLDCLDVNFDILSFGKELTEKELISLLKKYSQELFQPISVLELPYQTKELVLLTNILYGYKHINETLSKDEDILIHFLTLGLSLNAIPEKVITEKVFKKAIEINFNNLSKGPQHLITEELLSFTINHYKIKENDTFFMGEKIVSLLSLTKEHLVFFLNELALNRNLTELMLNSLLHISQNTDNHFNDVFDYFKQHKFDLILIKQEKEQDKKNQFLLEKITNLSVPQTIFKRNLLNG